MRRRNPGQRLTGVQHRERPALDSWRSFAAYPGVPGAKPVDSRQAEVPSPTMPTWDNVRLDVVTNADVVAWIAEMRATGLSAL